MAEMTTEILFALLSTPVDYTERHGEPTAYHTPENGFGIAIAADVPADAVVVATRNEVEGAIGGDLEFLDELPAGSRDKVLALTLDNINVSIEDL